MANRACGSGPPSACVGILSRATERAVAGPTPRHQAHLLRPRYTECMCFSGSLPGLRQQDTQCSYRLQHWSSAPQLQTEACHGRSKVVFSVLAQRDLRGTWTQTPAALPTDSSGSSSPAAAAATAAQLTCRTSAARPRCSTQFHS